MKKFRVKHGQCGSVIFPKTLSFESSKYLIAGSRILYFWQVLESIHKFIIELNALQCLFVWDLIKNKERVGLFQISLKERLFISYDNQVLLGYLIMWPTFLHPPKKAFSSPSLWPRREHSRTFK